MVYVCFMQGCELEARYLCLCLCSETHCCEFHLQEHLKLPNRAHSFNSIFEEPHEWTKISIFTFLTKEKYKKEKLKNIVQASCSENSSIEESLKEVDFDLKEINLLIEKISQIPDKDLILDNSEKAQEMHLIDSEPYRSVKNFLKLCQLRHKKYELLNRTKIDLETEQDFKKICSLYENHVSDPLLSQAYQELINAYHKITSLYLIKNKYLFVYNTESNTEEAKVLEKYQATHNVIIQIPNGELFYIGRENSSCIAFIIDRNYRFRELPAGIPKDCSTACYFNRNIYCFGTDHNYNLFKRFDLDKNRWIEFAQMNIYGNYYIYESSFEGESYYDNEGSNEISYDNEGSNENERSYDNESFFESESSYGGNKRIPISFDNSVIFNGDIIISALKINNILFLYSIDTDSFSEITLDIDDCGHSSWDEGKSAYDYEPEYDKRKILINTEERLYLIYRLGEVYESEIENLYNWTEIFNFQQINDKWKQVYCSYTNWKICISINYKKSCRKYFCFDLAKKELYKTKFCCGDPEIEPDVNFYKCGKALNRKGKYHKAVKYFNKAIEIKPKSAKYYLHKGKSLFYERESNKRKIECLNEAIECFDEAIKLNSEFKGYNWKAKALQKLSENIEEIECYNELIKLYPEDWNAYYNKVKALKKLERYPELVEFLNDLIKINPENLYGYYKKGSALNHLCRYLEAIECYKELLKLQPEKPKPYLKIIYSLKKLKRYSETIEYYNEAIKIEPYNQKFYIEKGDTLMHMRRYLEAIECYDKLIKLSPTYPPYHSLKGDCLLYLDRCNEAIECYNIAINLKPDNISFYVNKPFTLRYFGRNLEAIEFYNKLIQLRPKDTDFYCEKGETLHELGRYLEAIECYNIGIKLDPKPSLYVNKGNALYELGRYFEAIECYNIGIKLDPEPSLYVNKGNALYELDRYFEAIECYDKACELDIKSWIIYLNKGKALYELGRYLEAIECFDKIINRYPKDAYLYKGEALDSLGRNLEAIECYNEIIKIDPKDAYFYIRKANELHNVGRNSEAIECYNEAIMINHKDPIYFCYRGNVLSDMGQEKEAIKDFDRAYNLMSGTSDSWYIDSKLISDCLKLIKMAIILLESVAKFKEEIKTVENSSKNNLEAEEMATINEKTSKILKRVVECLDPRENIPVEVILQIKKEVSEHQKKLLINMMGICISLSRFK